MFHYLIITIYIVNDILNFLFFGSMIYVVRVEQQVKKISLKLFFLLVVSVDAKIASSNMLNIRGTNYFLFIKLSYLARMSISISFFLIVFKR